MIDQPSDVGDFADSHGGKDDGGNAGAVGNAQPERLKVATGMMKPIIVNPGWVDEYEGQLHQPDQEEAEDKGPATCAEVARVFSNPVQLRPKIQRQQTASRFAP